MGDLNSGNSGGFGHMGDNDPYNDGSSGSGGYSVGGNGGRNNNGVSDDTEIHLQSTNSYDGLYMAMCLNNLKAHEGFKNVMYKDQDGNITIGIGHLLSTPEMAEVLPFTRTAHFHAHGDDITKEVGISTGEIIGAFNAYKKDSSDVPDMHISNDAVINQCISDVQEKESGLRGLYSDFDNFPEHAKVALVDMGFNLGIPRLKNEFPKFNAAVRAKDWNTAAIESHRNLNQRGDIRNKDTAEQFLQAAKGQ